MDAAVAPPGAQANVPVPEDGVAVRVTGVPLQVVGLLTVTVAGRTTVTVSKVELEHPSASVADNV